MLRRVTERVPQQLTNVRIGEGVEHVLPLTPPDHEPLALEQAQALRHDWHRIAGPGGDVGHAQLAVGQQLEHPEPATSPAALSMAAARCRTLALTAGRTGSTETG